jgi:hypothetical protein
LLLLGGGEEEDDENENEKGKEDVDGGEGVEIEECTKKQFQRKEPSNIK